MLKNSHFTQMSTKHLKNGHKIHDLDSLVYQNTLVHMMFQIHRLESVSNKSDLKFLSFQILSRTTCTSVVAQVILVLPKVRWQFEIHTKVPKCQMAQSSFGQM